MLTHALDRTGPPMLALAAVRAAASLGIEVIELVSLRGGELIGEFATDVDVHVVLDPQEPWDHRAVDADRREALRRRYASAPSADVTVLVSVAAAPVLDVLPSDALGLLVPWVVEQGEDLHFVSDHPGLATSAVWLAGSHTSAAELRSILGPGPVIRVTPEFVEAPAPPGDATIAHLRAGLGASSSTMLVVGAGIATHRKAPDLFIELAAAVRRRGESGMLFAWVGGERDALFWPTVNLARGLGLDNVRFVGTVPQLDPWLAAADVFAHTARLDAFPLVCLHAAANGTPVVGFSGTGGTDEMFAEAFCGVPYPDVEGLASTLLGLREPRRRGEIGGRQRARIREHFTAEVAAPRLFTVLDEIVSTALRGVQ
ncbi:MAG TPA: glycosyltransferase [Microthrixaceae bacterium]|nr:glycosyltransferase [Microthrixaceae bacterium]HMT25216.1 glycosyltransferase [Microthrixaceae bacterium]HMT60781.1 glycosyltransferase [Microthrixaceae bacterium]